MTLEEQMDTVDEKLKRTSKFLHEIQALSPVCEEPLHEDIKEKQVRKTAHCNQIRQSDKKGLGTWKDMQ